MAEAFLVLIFVFMILAACFAVVMLNWTVQELRRTMKESYEVKKNDQIGIK